MSRQPIGQLQGNWALMFKIFLALVPIYAACDLAMKAWFVREHFELRERVVVIETHLKVAGIGLPDSDHHNGGTY